MPCEADDIGACSLLSILIVDRPESIDLSNNNALIIHAAVLKEVKIKKSRVDIASISLAAEFRSCKCLAVTLITHPSAKLMLIL